MGMFDTVNFEMCCPKCGGHVGGFQSKSGACIGEMVDPHEVTKFYSACKCGAWIEFARTAPDRVKREKPFTVAEVLAMSFVMTVKNG